MVDNTKCCDDVRTATTVACVADTADTEAARVVGGADRLSAGAMAMVDSGGRCTTSAGGGGGGVELQWGV